MARKPIEISKFARDAALQFLAQPKKYERPHRCGSQRPNRGRGGLHRRLRRDCRETGDGVDARALPPEGRDTALLKCAGDDARKREGAAALKMRHRIQQRRTASISENISAQRLRWRAQ
jgi:hypothetical protein